MLYCCFETELFNALLWIVLISRTRYDMCKNKINFIYNQTAPLLTPPQDSESNININQGKIFGPNTSPFEGPIKLLKVRDQPVVSE